MEDLPLFKHVEARARTSDHWTSHAAARITEATNNASTQRLILLDAVRETPGLTAREYAEKTGLNEHTPARRLPELREAGLIANGEDRKCTVGGRMSMTWKPVITRNAQNEM